MISIRGYVLMLMLFAAPALSQEGERIATLETELRIFRREVDKRLERIEEQLDDKRQGVIAEYGPFGILGALLILDKAGYYIRRKNGNERNGR